MSGLFPDKNPFNALTGLGSVGGLASKPAPLGLGMLAPQSASLALGLLMPNALSSLEGLDTYRRRQEWNERFGHWSKPESTTETAQIERARQLVSKAIANNARLKLSGVSIEEQGSFTNRTNVRNESDIDLRVQHPGAFIDYDSGVDSSFAYRQFGYTPIAAEDLAVTAAQMRIAIGDELVQTFGRAAVDLSGRKAIKVNGVDGSRSEVDVVPCVSYHRIHSSNGLVPFFRTEGVAILGTDNSWTYNYPAQHSANGIRKRWDTQLQFKRVVRIVKRLRADMEERGLYTQKTPSFLCECLVYLAEDRFFITEDMYSRVKGVLTRVALILADDVSAAMAREINEQKPLFGQGQAWTRQSVASFVWSALAHLGDA